MIVKMFVGTDDILLFRVDDSGEGIGEDEYFESEEDRESYAVRMVEFPIRITASLEAEPNRVHS